MSTSVGPNGQPCAPKGVVIDQSNDRGIEMVPNTWNHRPGPEVPCCPKSFDYDGYARIIEGRGTVCIPLAANGDVPSPQQTSGVGTATLGTTSGPSSPVTNLAIQDSRYQEDFGLSQGLNYELIPPEEIQKLWNQVVQDSSNRISQGVVKDSQREEKEKMKKLELLLAAALNSGNIDLAMLLMSGLETKEINAIAGNLMGRMQELQQERRSYTDDLAKLGTSAEDSKQANTLNTKIGNVGTEIQFLQVFLQDIMGQKNESQQMASNYIKSKHDTATSIVRNMA